jgi:hypothetical protein
MTHGITSSQIVNVVCMDGKLHNPCPCLYQTYDPTFLSPSAQFFEYLHRLMLRYFDVVGAITELVGSSRINFAHHEVKVRHMLLPFSRRFGSCQGSAACSSWTRAATRAAEIQGTAACE